MMLRTRCFLVAALLLPGLVSAAPIPAADFPGTKRGIQSM